MPLDIGAIHFVGIGGIGMSGIAEVMHNLGYTVQGSDISNNANVKRLRDMGIAVAIGHDADHLGEAKVVVISSAVKRDNQELAAARARHVPVVRRAEMLAELMRLKSCIAVGGTHGKTTTTSFVAALLEAGGLDPTVINGGIINAYGTNARLGAGAWMVVEADESDGTFVKLPAEIAIVTNIDPEHLDHYGDFDAARRAFSAFVENIPFYGFGVMCLDHPEVQALVGHIEDRRIITYGCNPQADAQLVNFTTSPEGTSFDAVLRGAASGEGETIAGLKLPMLGLHNALNALAAVVVERELGIDPETIRTGLAGFRGVGRRFARVGEVNGVTIFDDYAHHPVEIAAVLAAARSAARDRVIAVVQPHRYTRLRDLFDEFCACFNDSDVVVVADVYPAGEQPIEGFSRNALVRGVIASGHRHVLALEGPDALPGLLGELASAGDFVIFLGAGSITQWANALPGQLEKRAEAAR